MGQIDCTLQLEFVWGKWCVLQLTTAHSLLFGWLIPALLILSEKFRAERITSTTCSISAQVYFYEDTASLLLSNTTSIPDNMD